MLMVLWTVDTDDYLRPGVSVIMHRALAGAPGRDHPHARRERRPHPDDRRATADRGGATGWSRSRS
jgi:hypothetical protein